MLEVRNVSHAYSGEPALRNVTVAFPSIVGSVPADDAAEQGGGSLIALTGANGSGKSTLLKILARVLAPSAGEVLLDARRVREWPSRDYARQVGYLPQEPDVAFPMRAIDVVASGRAPFLGRFEWESDLDYEAAQHALETCDAEHLATRYLDEMSGGERKRVFLARVLAGTPRIVLLDEPLAALDLSHIEQFSRLLRDIADRTRSTVIFVSHDLNWAAAYSDRMLVMQEGELVLDAPPREVMRTEVLRELFGLASHAVEVDGRAWIVPNVR
jgi:iron complex transport system ATP-binding protein